MSKTKEEKHKCQKWDKCTNFGTHTYCAQPIPCIISSCPFYKKIKKVEDVKE